MDTGHESGGIDETRRVFPWLTLAIAIVSTVAFGAEWAAGRGVSEAADVTLDQAAEYFVAHPFLDAPPSLRERMGARTVDGLAATFRRDEDQRGAPPLPPRVVARQQSTLDEMVAGASAQLEKSPIYRFGLVPARPDLLARFVHPFVHRNSIHLFGNVAFLLVLGGFLESVWGATLLAAVFAVVIVASGAAFTLSAPGLAAPLLGASGVVAGLLGAFAVRCWPERRDIPYAWIVVAGVAWSVAPVAAGDIWSVARNALSGAESAMLGVQSQWALLGGAAAGLLSAGAIGLLQIGPRVVNRAQDARRTLVENSALVEARRAHGEGRTREAFDLLARAQHEAPADRDVALSMWEVAIELGRLEVAAAAMIRVIREELACGDLRPATEHWHDLCARGLDRAADSGLLIRLAGALRTIGSSAAALSALQSALARAPESAVPSVATRVALAAAELDAEIATVAAWRALGSADLALDQRQELESLLGRLQPSPAAESDAIEFGTAPSHPLRRRDEVGLPVVEDLTDALDSRAEAREAAPPRRRAGDLPAGDPRALEIVMATPIAREPGRLTVDCSGEGKVELDLGEVEIVAVAAVAGLAPKPVILVDLVTRAMSLGDEPLRIVRLSADRFDPRSLVPEADSQVEALRSFLDWLARECRAELLPDARAAVGRPFATFESLAVYETEVLGRVDSGERVVL